MNDMKPDWRWIVIVLLALNIAAAFMFLLAGEPPVRESAEPSPPDPGLPHVELVREVAPRTVDTAGRVQCFTIGPLPTLLAQQRAEQRLQPFTTRMQTRRTTADQDRGWWVYLPAASRSEALQLTRRLAEQGVDDYYVVAGGELANAVSVGLYESLDNARSRQARVRAMGFDAQLEVRREAVPRFWIDYRVEPGQEPPWRFILRASPGAQRVAIPCFASPLEESEGDADDDDDAEVEVEVRDEPDS